MGDFKKNKKAELTTQQIVTLVILIVSFVVVLLFLFYLNPKNIAEKDICRNSVVLNSKTAGLGGGIDCTTNYVCISGGEDCEGFNAKEKVEIDLGDDEKVKNETMKVLAEKMAECWWMFGEGRVDWDALGISVEENYALCSSVRFDSKIQQEISSITYSEFYEYLAKEKISSSETYLHYLYDLFNSQDFKPQEQFNLDTNKPIDTSKRYSIITGFDNNFPEDNELLRVHIIATEDTSNIGGEFITKS